MDQSGLRNLRDFLLQYNKISQTCFLQCVNHLSDRDLSQDESRCVDACTRKHVSVNHKVMQVYIEVQPQIVNRRIEEVNKQKAALEAQQTASQSDSKSENESKQSVKDTNENVSEEQTVMKEAN